MHFGVIRQRLANNPDGRWPNGRYVRLYDTTVKAFFDEYGPPPEIWIDLEIGGTYRFGMQPPEGELFYLVGKFIEIDAPRRLAYAFRWEDPDPDDQETVVTLALNPDAGQTRLSLSHGPFATDVQLALHTSGWTLPGSSAGC